MKVPHWFCWNQRHWTCPNLLWVLIITKLCLSMYCNQLLCIIVKWTLVPYCKEVLCNWLIIQWSLDSSSNQSRILLMCCYSLFYSYSNWEYMIFHCSVRHIFIINIEIFALYLIWEIFIETNDLKYIIWNVIYFSFLKRLFISPRTRTFLFGITFIVKV